jgi:hypothetical protein
MCRSRSPLTFIGILVKHPLPPCNTNQNPHARARAQTDCHLAVQTKTHMHAHVNNRLPPTSCLLLWPTTSVSSSKHMRWTHMVSNGAVWQLIYIGLARTVYVHHIWPYVWRFLCQKYRIHTVSMYGSGQPYTYIVCVNIGEIRYRQRCARWTFWGQCRTQMKHKCMTCTKHCCKRHRGNRGCMWLKILCGCLFVWNLDHLNGRDH